MIIELLCALPGAMLVKVSCDNARDHPGRCDTKPSETVAVLLVGFPTLNVLV